MRTRLLWFGLLAAVSQTFATGCFFHPVARWRANHPCAPCAGVVHRPILHRPALAAEPVGPVIGHAPCHGCNVAPGVPVGYGGYPADLVPVTGVPSFGHPYPITPGPTVVPSTELPNPMPVPKNGTKQ